MVQFNLMNGIMNILSNAELVTNRSYNFWSWFGDLFVKMGFGICRAFMGLIYVIIKFILNIVDLLQYFVKRLIGLDFWGTSKVFSQDYMESDIVFRFIKNPTVQQVFTYMLGIFAVLVIVFTIVAIIKSEYAYVTSGADNSKKTIFGRAFKALFMVIMVPIFIVVGIMASNAVLQGIVNAFALNNNITLGGQVFVGSAYNANKYRNYANEGKRYPTSTEITFYYKTNSAGDLINISTQKFSDYTGKYTLNTTVPTVVPSRSSRVTGFVFKGVSTEPNTEFFWKVYDENEGLSSAEKKVREQVTEYFITGGTNNINGLVGHNPESLNYSLVQTTAIKKIIPLEIEYVNLWKDIKVENLKKDQRIMRAIYNSWYYNEYMTQVADFDKTVTEVNSPFTSNYGVQYYSAKRYENAPQWACRYDGGANGLVALPSEYKVMGDFVDFMVQNCIECSIVDITSSRIDWQKVVETNRDVQKYYNTGALNSIGQFMVEYADEGYVVYNPVHGAVSEIEGACYIMCYTDLETGMYVPVLANTTQKVRMATVNRADTYYDTYKFTSDYLGENYCGFILARGGFTEKSTTWISKPGLPTYISVKTAVENGNTGLITNIKYNEKYNIDSKFEYVTFNYEKAESATGSVEFSPYGDSNNYVQTVDDGSGTYYQWKSAVPLGLEDEKTTEIDPTTGNPVEVYTRYGITGEKKPLDLVFKRNGEYAKATGYSYINEYGNMVFGFAFTGGTRFLVEYCQNSADRELKIIQCDIFYYKYTKGSSDYYLYDDGNFYINDPDGTGAGVEIAKISFYDMRFVSADKDALGNPTSVIYEFEGYSYGAMYKAAMMSSSSSRTNVEYIPNDSAAPKGYVYDIKYYNYYSSYVNGSLLEYNINSNDIKTLAIPLQVSRGIVLEEDIYLGRTIDSAKKPDSITFSDPHMLFYIPSTYTGTGTDADIIKDVLTNKHYYQYQDATYLIYKKISSFASKDDAKDFFGNAVMHLDFVNTRAEEGAWFFDFHLDLLDLFSTSNTTTMLRFKLGIGTSYAQSFIIESFEDGEFYLDYNFMDGVGPEMKTMYSVANLNYLILVFGAIMLLKVIGKAVWGLIARIYEIVLYFLVMPGIASMLPLESGEGKFKDWRDQLIKKVLGTYGVMIGLNVFFILLDPIREASKIFNAADMARMTSGIGRLLSGSASLLNSIVYIMFLLVAFTMIETAPKMISDLVGGEDMVKKGNDTKKAAINNAKAVTTEMGDIISGKKLLEAPKKAGEALKKGAQFLPGSAIWGKPLKNGIDKVKDSLFGKDKNADMSDAADPNAETQNTGDGGTNPPTPVPTPMPQPAPGGGSGGLPPMSFDIPDNTPVPDSGEPIEATDDQEFNVALAEAQNTIDENKIYDMARKELSDEGISGMDLDDQTLDAKADEIRKRLAAEGTSEAEDEQKKLEEKKELEEKQKFAEDSALYDKARKNLARKGMSSMDITDEDLDAEVDRIKKRKEAAKKGAATRAANKQKKLEREKELEEKQKFAEDSALYSKARKNLEAKGMSSMDITDEDLDAEVDRIKNYSGTGVNAVKAKNEVAKKMNKELKKNIRSIKKAPTKAQVDAQVQTEVNKTIRKMEEKQAVKAAVEKRQQQSRERRKKKQEQEGDNANK